MLSNNYSMTFTNESSTTFQLADCGTNDNGPLAKWVNKPASSLPSEGGQTGLTMELDGTDIELPPGNVWCIWWDSVSTWGYGFRINMYENVAHMGKSPTYSYGAGQFSSAPSHDDVDWVTVSGASTVGPENTGILNVLINGTQDDLQESLQIMLNDPGSA